MNICAKEDYLEQVKNRMLFHCSHRDIRLTLEDLNLYFESGQTEGRTEENLCGELGSPAEFAADLLQEKEIIRPRAAFAGCAAGSLILCILVFRLVRDPELPLSCLTAILPAFLCYSFGGRCLFQIRRDTVSNHRKSLLYLVSGAAVSAAQQFLITLVCNNASPAPRFLLATHFLSLAWMAASSILLVSAARKLYRGYYLALGSLAVTTGAICSSLMYSHLLFHMGSPVFSLRTICSLPFAAGIVSGSMYCIFIKIRERIPDFSCKIRMKAPHNGDR